ncbi:MAG: STAS/SEC14 domain-containing protein [Myxococcota bacterium]|nr:STAS/SEC14 domain-containing protein [Myxococcota bacterium]
MGIRYRFEDDAILHLEVFDPLDVEEIRAFVEALLADPQLRQGLDILSDHSRLAATATTQMVGAVLPLLEKLGARLGRFRCAIVAPEDASFGMARMAGTLAGDGPATVHAFRTLAEAQAWLASDAGR